jgi:hypothetical protein
MWPELYSVFAALDGGDTAEAQRRWDTSTKTPDGTYCQRAAGAIQMGYEEFNPPQPMPTKPTNIGKGQEVPWFDSPKDQVNVTIADDDGRVSMADSGGGAEDWISKDPGFPLIEGVTSKASGQSGFLDVKAGDSIYTKQTTQADAEIHITMSS